MATSGHWRTASALTVGAAAALVHAAPAALILPTMWRSPPTRLGSVCRWSAPAERGSALTITFDDGPDGATPRTLDVLDDLGLRATFFLLGEQLERFPEIGGEIVSRGHEVATHGYSHRHHLLSSPGAVRRDIGRALEVHERVLGAVPRFFRPPYGQLALGSLLAARRLDLEVVLWSIWGKEWADRERASVLARLCPGLKGGAVVLLHDNDVSCRRGTGDFTRSLLPALSDSLHQAGLRCVPLGELVDVDGPRTAALSRREQVVA